MYGGPVGTHQCSFEWYHSRPSTTSPSPRLGVCNPHSKLQSKILGKQVLLCPPSSLDWRFATPTQNSNQKSRVNECTYMNSLHGRHTGFSGGNRECGHSQGLPRVFWLSLINSGTGKATDFKYCTHIHRVNWNKSLKKIWGKIAVGTVRESRKFSWHPHMGHTAWSSLR